MESTYRRKEFHLLEIILNFYRNKGTKSPIEKTNKITQSQCSVQSSYLNLGGQHSLVFDLHANILMV